LKSEINSKRKVNEKKVTARMIVPKPDQEKISKLCSKELKQSFIQYSPANFHLKTNFAPNKIQRITMLQVFMVPYNIFDTFLALDLNPNEKKNTFSKSVELDEIFLLEN
jgi:hypothetical protein